MRPRRVVLALLTATTLGAASGCSASSTPALSDSAAALLQGDVAALTSAAANHQFATERTALAKLTTDLTHARSSGDISAERAATIQAAIAAINRDLTTAGATSPSEPPASSSEAANPRPTPTPPTPSKNGKGHGRGKGGSD